jgi:hypothetical protein
MKKVLVAAATVVLLSAPALAQYGGGENAGGPMGSQLRQSTGGAWIATTGWSGTAKKGAKARKRMNTISGNCWDATNPACQNYRGPRRR